LFGEVPDVAGRRRVRRPATDKKDRQATVLAAHLHKYKKTKNDYL